MIKTLDIREIFAATASSAGIARLLRLEILSSTGSYQTSIRPRLQQGKVDVDVDAAACMAKIALLLGVQHNSTFEHHRDIVSDIVASYRMVVNYHDAEAWRNIAAPYAHSICRESQAPISAKDQALLKLAFLEGLRLGASYDFRMSKIDARTIESLQRKARLIGLEDPGRIVSGEADAVKLHVGLEQSRQWKVFECRPSQVLLADEEVDGESSVFQMGEDGLVI